MHERGMIKWAPFNSVINENEIIKELKEEKVKIVKPILSEDQLWELEENIVNAFNDQSEVIISYYHNAKEIIVTGKITKIDSITKNIIINKSTIIHFNNIIKLEKKY